MSLDKVGSYANSLAAQTRGVTRMTTLASLLLCYVTVSRQGDDHLLTSRQD